MEVLAQTTAGRPDDLAGPVYLETDLSQAIVEPLNAATAALFVLIAIVWLIRLRRRWRERPFLLACLALLTIGGVGGTVYHAFRGHPVWLLMDWVPIAILGVAGSVYLFAQLLRQWGFALLVIPGYVAFQFGNFNLIARQSRHVAIAISYTTLAAMPLIPAVIILIKTRFRNGWLPLSALACFALALLCRQYDAQWPEVLPRGMHFLWHGFGAAATWLILEYFDRLPDVLAETNASRVTAGPDRNPR